MVLHMHNLRYLLIFAVVAACSSEEQASVHSFRVYEENGVTIAETTGGPKYVSELFQYEKILEIWPDSAQPESFLIDPTDVVMDKNGYIYVLDGRENRIAVYNPEGSYVRSIGREGSGPGDLRTPNRVRIQNDLLHVNQFSAPAKLSIFNLDGSLVDVLTDYTVDRGSGSSGSTLPVLFKASDGSLVVHMFSQRDVENQVQITANAIVYSASGDSVSEISAGPIPMRQLVNFKMGNRWTMRVSNIHFPGFPWIVFHPDSYLVTTTGIDPVIDFYDLSGELKRRVVVALAPERISGEEKQELREHYDQLIQDTIDREGTTDWQLRWARYERNNIVYPDYKSYWYGLYIDSNNFIWLQIPEVSGRVPHQNHRAWYRVLGADGEYLGNTQWPISLNPAGIGPSIVDNKLLTIVVDESTGEQIPTVYRIIPMVEGLRFPPQM